MSRMKQHAMSVNELAMAATTANEELERARWELDRAVSNYVEVLLRLESARREANDRRADDELKAGRLPF